MRYITILLLGLLILLFSCQKNTDTIKISDTDPFKESIVESQFYNINPNEENIITGKNGTTILLPTGSIIGATSDEVKIEIAEALTMKDAILSNLTTTSNGEPLETDGMIYFNLTDNGKQLSINPEIPVYIEIPTSNKQNGMSAYKGTRDDMGNMNWTNPKPIKNYLTIVDMAELNFYPKGFRETVETNMPFLKHAFASKELTDSLYYSFSKYQQGDLTNGFINTNLNEPFYNSNAQVINGSYTSTSYSIESGDSIWSEISESVDDAANASCGIDPAKIKTLLSSKFEQSYIATKEFERRLQTIFTTCENDIIEIYVDNIDKNLYIADSLAYIYFMGTEYENVFYNFYSEKLTNVDASPEYLSKLKSYYDEKLLNVNSELDALRNLSLEKLDEQNKEIEKITEEYQNLLFQRESYRMETYGFEWSETGWINIDRGIIPKDYGEKKIEVNVINGNKFDAVYTYTIYEKIKSLNRLNTTDNINFYAGNETAKRMLTPINGGIYIISIGYKDTFAYLGGAEINDKDVIYEEISLIEVSKEELNIALEKFCQDTYEENQILKDLEYMELFHRERQQELYRIEHFIYELHKKVYPCCTVEIELSFETQE